MGHKKQDIPGSVCWMEADTCFQKAHKIVARDERVVDNCLAGMFRVVDTVFLHDDDLMQAEAERDKQLIIQGGVEVEVAERTVAVEVERKAFADAVEVLGTADSGFQEFGQEVGSKTPSE